MPRYVGHLLLSLHLKEGGLFYPRIWSLVHHQAILPCLSQFQSNILSAGWSFQKEKSLQDIKLLVGQDSQQMSNRWSPRLPIDQASVPILSVGRNSLVIVCTRPGGLSSIPKLHHFGLLLLKTLNPSNLSSMLPYPDSRFWGSTDNRVMHAYALYFPYPSY